MNFVQQQINLMIRTRKTKIQLTEKHFMPLLTLKTNFVCTVIDGVQRYLAAVVFTIHSDEFVYPA